MNKVTGDSVASNLFTFDSIRVFMRQKVEEKRNVVANAQC